MSSAPNQFQLLRQRRFAPFFWTQFLGAGNDNLFKFGFTVLVTYQLQVAWLPPSLAGLVIGGVFISPFLLFSATSGQLADRLEKGQLMRWIKDLEIAIMLLGAIGFWFSLVGLLLACVFLMGLHSTLFGPVKYAYLPQHLDARELTGGNGMVEMGTFVAILLGNLLGGLLISLPQDGARYTAMACVLAAMAGRLTAQAIPVSPPADPALRIDWNPVRVTLQNLRLASQNVVVFRSLLGISWMWFYGAVFLSTFPSFAREVLQGDEQVASLLLVVFSIGIAIGSLLCERLSHRQVEIGLVPLGSIGMTLFAVDLWLATRALETQAAPLGVAAFLAVGAHARVLFDLMLLALCAGLYSVPMYALIQSRCEPTHRARVIAANNILNALFMIASAGLTGVLLAAGLTLPEVFLVIALLNAAVSVYIFWLVPEYLLRFIAWGLAHGLYRFEVREGERIPESGAAILICNHVSFVDAILLMSASPRPIRFLMDHRIFAHPLLGPVFRLARAIPVAPRAEDPEAYARAMAAALQVLDEGDLLGIFPEGNVTRDGTLAPFKAGVLRILAERPVPVVPMALSHLWGSFFSRIEGGRAMVRPFRRGFYSRVTLAVGPVLAPSQAELPALEQAVRALILPDPQPRPEGPVSGGRGPGA